MNIKIINLKVCSLKEPLGIDKTPTFSWILSGNKRGECQTAYRIILASTSDNALNGIGDIWDSGKVTSSFTVDILYTGAPLASKSTYYWSVFVWDSEGQRTPASPVSRFSTGVLDDSLWKGEWIGIQYAKDREAIMLRKEFSVLKPVKEAYVYICGLGFFDLLINGQNPDDSVLNPFITQYNKTVLYRTFDVTNLICKGNNTIGVELGNSFYYENGGVWNWQDAEWRDNPKLFMNLDIRYEDGTNDIIITDRSWKGTNQGPIIKNSMYYGDTYDARKEQDGFSISGFDDSHWCSCIQMKAPLGELNASMKTPVKRIASYHPKEIRKLSNSSYLVTSPEMVAGWIKLFHINEESGHYIYITYGQELNADGTVVKWGGRDGKSNHWWPEDYIQQDKYIAKGRGNEAYEPKFSYKGFQYIQIDGYTGELASDDITIFRVSNDVERVSDFSCSNEVLNTLHRMMCCAMSNNFQGEHCDPFIEKNGWLGDANVSLSCLMYNYDMPGCLPGWIEVMQDCLKLYGLVPIMVPTADWGVDNHPVWNTLFVYGVEALERYYGMRHYAIDKYEFMRLFALKHIDEMKGNRWTCYDNKLGDWVSPMGGSNPDVKYNENASEGSGLVGTAFVYGVLSYLDRLAIDMNKTEDAEEYRAAMKQIYDAFNDRYYLMDLGIYQTTIWNQIGCRTQYRQTSNLVALAFGLVPPERKKGVVENLVKDIISKSYHLDTGCIGTRYILPILSDNGYIDIAYKIVTQITYPSWGYWIANGATSTWEMWEATTRSYDHYFLGTYDEWFYSHLAGITDIQEGYRSFVIKPHFSGYLQHAHANIKTVRGEVYSGWSLKDDRTADIKVTVPCGSTATIWFPTSNVEGITLDGLPILKASVGVNQVIMKNGVAGAIIGSGQYQFISPIDVPMGK
jgi:hypothetical protein